MNERCCYCDRVPFSTYNSLQARHYSEKCVHDLINDSKFKSFWRHKQWLTTVSFLRLFISLLIVIFISYCWHFAEQDVLSDQQKTQHRVLGNIFSIFQSKPSLSSSFPCLRVMTLGCALYLLPASLLLSFVGNSEVVHSNISSLIYVFWTLFHFIFSEYNRDMGNGSTETTCISQVVFLAAWDTLSVQGYLIASLLVGQWVSSRWEHAWLIWCPVLTFPLLIGLCGVGFRYLLHGALIYILSSSSTDRNTFSHIGEGLDGISFAASVYREIVLSYDGLLKYPEKIISTKNFIHFPVYDHRELIDNPQTLYCVFLMTSIYFLVSLLVPLVCKQAIYLMGFFPSHPSTWGMLFVGTIASLVVCFTLCPGAFLMVGSLILGLFCLLYNGFVA